MRRFIIGLTVVSLFSSGLFAQDEFDDIYYNPNAKTKSGSKKSDTSNTASKSNYIADFSNMDVDDYNKRGFYYETDIDTIGVRAETTEDFVYTQQIQKYYNPTIVVDNADLLEDIIDNTYGNVNVVIKNSVPVFTSVYYGDYIWGPGYYNWCYRPSWTWNYAWGPFSWSYSSSGWGYNPVWGWVNPGWAYWDSFGYWGGWGYGPHYPWIPVHRPGPGPHRPYYVSYNRPGAGRPVGVTSGWAANTRPGNHRRPSGINGSRFPSNATSRPHGNGITSTNRNRYESAKVNSASSSHSISSIDGNKTIVGAGTNRGNVTTVRKQNAQSSASSVVNNRTGKNSKENSAKSARNNSVNSQTKSSTMNSATNRYNSSGNRSTYDRSYNSNYNNGYNSNSNNSYNNRSYNSGSSSRSYNSGAASRSYNRSTSTSRSSGGSHGGGRGGRR